MQFKNSVLLSIVLILTFLLVVSAKETLLMVIHGSVFYNGGTTLVPNGWNVEVTNKIQNFSQVSKTGVAGDGRYSVTFIDFGGGIVAAAGDEIEIVITDADDNAVQIIDADGRKQESVTYILTDEDIDVNNATIDIEVESHAKEFSRWDINEDEVVDISDLALVSIHFGGD